MWQRPRQHRALLAVHGGAERAFLFLNANWDWTPPLWIGVDDAQDDENMVTLGALGAHAAYRATNAARRAGGLPAPEGARAFQHALREAVAGHAPSERLLVNIWRHAPAAGRRDSQRGDDLSVGHLPQLHAAGSSGPVPPSLPPPRLSRVVHLRGRAWIQACRGGDA